MDYHAHYNKLIERARTRVLEGYGEWHHILPRCLGGTDSSENLVHLTPEEHYVAHQLLIKIYPNEPKLIYAARMMTIDSCDTDRPKNKLYGWLKQKHAKAVSENLSGRKQSKEHIEKRAAALRGQNYGTGNRKGVKLSNETKEKMRIAKAGIKHEIVACPHCNKAGGGNSMLRWHFSRCKEMSKV